MEDRMRAQLSQEIRATQSRNHQDWALMNENIHFLADNWPEASNQTTEETTSWGVLPADFESIPVRLGEQFAPQDTEASVQEPIAARGEAATSAALSSNQICTLNSKSSAMETSDLEHGSCHNSQHQPPLNMVASSSSIDRAGYNSLGQGDATTDMSDLYILHDSLAIDPQVISKTLTEGENNN
jgi:hypothetical protein